MSDSYYNIKKIVFDAPYNNVLLLYLTLAYSLIYFTHDTDNLDQL